MAIKNLLLLLVLLAVAVSASPRTDRALALVGKSRSEYVCNHVVNYAINGNKNIGGLAKDYLKWGWATSSLGPGRVVVGLDGVHVGIMVSASEIVHSSSSRYQVIKVSASQIPYIFPKGYSIRTDGMSSDAPLSMEIPAAVEVAPEQEVAQEQPVAGLTEEGEDESGMVSNSARTDRALALVGKSRAEYVCNHVVNYAINGNKNIGGLAKDYLKWGWATSSLGPGRVVVGLDGVHVGIMVSASEIVHSSSSRYQVIKVSASQIPYIFPKGYSIRTDGLSLGLSLTQLFAVDSIVQPTPEPQPLMLGNSARVNRALALVGKSRSEYVCNHVVNYAINGNKNIGGLAKDYLKWGWATNSLAAGRVVVGLDGVHVGIMVSSGEIVHSSSSRYQVIKVSASQIPYIFPKGYSIRTDGQS